VLTSSPGPFSNVEKGRIQVQDVLESPLAIMERGLRGEVKEY
jgi:hypothetical protein